MFKKILMITAALGLVACSGSPRQEALAYQNSKDDARLEILMAQHMKTNRPQIFHPLIANKKLSKIYREWVGTSYRMGGTGKGGIDCSAFMQETFSSAFGITLPRSTSEQQSIGRRIHKTELKQGDLVFFRKNRHVGVYIGNDRFMHASTSQGVTISSLSENYWLRSYTQSRRVL